MSTAASGPRLTPAEDLLFQVAIARHRLGDTPYLIESRHRSTAQRLATKGLVWTDSGIVERTIKIGLTTLGEIVGISDYTPPALRVECPSWYMGTRSGLRIDCDMRRGHLGPHAHTEGFKRPGADGPRTVTWSDDEARGYDIPGLGEQYRAIDQQTADEAHELRQAVTEGRIDWTTGTVLPVEPAA